MSLTQNKCYRKTMMRGVQVTRNSIIEYAEAIRDRYWQNSKAGKTKILDEFTKTTGLKNPS